MRPDFFYYNHKLGIMKRESILTIDDNLKDQTGSVNCRFVFFGDYEFFNTFFVIMSSRIKRFIKITSILFGLKGDNHV